MAEIIKPGCLQLDRPPKGLGVKYNREVLSSCHCSKQWEVA